MSRYRYLVIAVMAGALCFGCGQKELDRTTAESNQVTELRPGLTKLKAGTSVLWVEVAQSEEDRARGLMFRKELPDDQGMLFVFEYPQQLSFWMKNTYLPLDIAFVDRDGRIINILQMKPLDEGPRYLSSGQAQYAIETNAGGFRKNGVKAGDRVKF